MQMCKWERERGYDMKQSVTGRHEACKILAHTVEGIPLLLYIFSILPDVFVSIWNIHIYLEVM